MATACAIIAMFGVVLFAWAGSGSGRDRSRQSLFGTGSLSERARASSSRASSATFAAPPVPLTPDTARRAAEAVARGPVSDAVILRTKGGQTIAALREEREQGTTQLLVIERKGRLPFRLTARAALDAEGFRGATWRAEAVDLDGDGYDEVLCTGTSARGGGDEEAGDRRLVLYVPRTRQTYSLKAPPDAARGPNTARAIWPLN
jgi:hypothetical protein